MCLRVTRRFEIALLNCITQYLPNRNNQGIYSAQKNRPSIFVRSVRITKLVKIKTSKVVNDRHRLSCYSVDVL